MANVDFFVVQQHTIDGFDRSLGGLSSLVVNKSISLGAALFISSNLARQHIAESGECVVESLSRCQM